MNKRTLAALAIVGVAGILCCWNAYAGMKSAPETVKIYGNNLRVMGSLGGARNSSNAKEYIGCKVIADLSGVQVVCSAQDSTGAQWDCSSKNANFIKVALGISGDSFLTLNRDKVSPSTCTYMAVDNTSDHQPKAP
jgi:hypothetical protein